MIASILGLTLYVLAIVLILDLSPRRVTEDLLQIITPHQTLHERIKAIRGGKRKKGIYYKLMAMKQALEATGKHKQFTFICFASLVLFTAGIFLSILIDNLFLLPALSVAFALIPFLYTANTISSYEKKTKEELETTLSIITTSYIRSDDIIGAIRENIPYIKHPLKETFLAFTGDATAVSSNIKRALYNLKEKLDDEIFREWCDTLIACQDDRTLKDTLLPVVSKLTDVRIVNNELKGMLAAARNEYWVMVALVVGNIPLLYVLNKDWFHTLIYETSGKVVLGICGAVILVTALFMLKFTKPIEYKR